MGVVLKLDYTVLSTKSTDSIVLDHLCHSGICTGMKADNYTVTCKVCKQSGRLGIMPGNSVLYKDHVPIISSRLRADAQWGFECQCGNNSLIAEDEVKDLDMLVQNTSTEVKNRTIQDIKDRLAAEPRNLFNMEKI